LTGTYDAALLRAAADAATDLAAALRNLLDAEPLPGPRTIQNDQDETLRCTAKYNLGVEQWAVCVLHEGHLTDHRSGATTWPGAW
jgi:hypothetical protein